MAPYGPILFGSEATWVIKVLVWLKLLRGSILYPKIPWMLVLKHFPKKLQKCEVTGGRTRGPKILVRPAPTFLTYSRALGGLILHFFSGPDFKIDLLILPISLLMKQSVLLAMKLAVKLAVRGPALPHAAFAAALWEEEMRISK